MLAKVWKRAKANPLVAVTLFLAVAALLNIWEYWTSTDNTSKAMLLTLAFGGFIATYGCLAENIDAESAGLALMEAALVFLLLFQFFKHPIDGASIAALLVNVGAFVVSLGIRLFVVRQAAKARRLVTRG